MLLFYKKYSIILLENACKFTVKFYSAAVLSHRLVCIVHDEKRFAAPKHRIRREVVLLFIYRLYIFYIT